MLSKSSLAMLSIGLASACSKSHFSGGVDRPSRDIAAGSDLGVHDTDCTDLEADACAAKRETEGALSSYRNVDCAGRSSADCDDLTGQDRARDGENGSEIRVANCREDPKEICDKIASEPKTVVTSRTRKDRTDCTDLSRAACAEKKKADGSSSSYRTVDCDGRSQDECESIVDAAQGIDDGDKVIVEHCPDGDGFCDRLGEEDHTKIASRSDPESEDSSIALNDVKWCAGGPVNAVYPFKTEADARNCFASVRDPSSVNSSPDCASQARVGRCSFKGKLKDAKARVASVIPGACICLFTDIAARAGITWDGTPGR